MSERKKTSLTRHCSTDPVEFGAAGPARRARPSAWTQTCVLVATIQRQAPPGRHTPQRARSHQCDATSPDETTLNHQLVQRPKSATDHTCCTACGYDLVKHVWPPLARGSYLAARVSASPLIDDLVSASAVKGAFGSRCAIRCAHL